MGPLSVTRPASAKPWRTKSLTSTSCSGAPLRVRSRISSKAAARTLSTRRPASRCVSRESGVQRAQLLGPTGVGDLLARQPRQLVALDAVFHALGLALGGDHVIPAARGALARGEAQNPVGQRIAQVVIEEQPPVQFLLAKFLLNVGEVHVVARVVTLKRLSKSSWGTPSISTTLSRLVKPYTMRTWERGTPASSAMKRTHSSFALPSTGGAASESFQASPRRPARAERLARGCTFTVRRAMPLWPSSSPRRPPRACPLRRKRWCRPASRGSNHPRPAWPPSGYIAAASASSPVGNPLPVRPPPRNRPAASARSACWCRRRPCRCACATGCPPSGRAWPHGIASARGW